MSDEPQEFTIAVRVEDGIGHLEWSGATTEETLTKTVSMASDDAIMGHGLRRLEILLPAPDLMARRAVQQAGFRLEGLKRQGMAIREGEFVDVACYARVASDVVYGPDGFSGVMTTVLPKTRALAHCLLRNAAGELLMVKTRYKEDWEFPGGVVEAHEPPHVAAAREVAEELGLDIVVGPLLAVDWMPPYLGWDDALQFIFDGGELSADLVAAITPDEGEIEQIHWVAWDDALSHLHPGAARRLASIRSAGGVTCYLEGGLPR